VGLLNIGVEEVKGLDQIKAAHAALKDTPLPIVFRGFVEGDEIGHGAADVVVTDGFTGNIALKTAEGTAKQIGEYFRAAMRRSLLARLGAVLAQGAFRALKEKMDPRQLNGGIFLGLNGIVVKSHGGTDATGFASAVDVAYDMASSGVVTRLADDVARFHAELDLDGAA
jgi:phosphate acyltransferase